MNLINFVEKKKVFLILLVLMAVLHVAATVYRLPNKFADEPSAGAFGGIRLYYLRIWNFDFSSGVSAQGGTSHILDNFIKSAVSGTHGMLDYLHWYLYIAVFNLFGIPLTEFWFLTAQTIMMVSALAIFCLLLAELYDSRAVALVFMFIAAQLYMRYSKSFYVIPPNTFMEGLLLWALYLYSKKGRGILLKSVLFFLIFASTASGNIVKLPVYLIFMWCVSYKHHGLGPAGFIKEGIIRRPFNLVFVIPLLAAVAGHYYIFSRLGSSHLGMFGWIAQKMGMGGAVSRFSMFSRALEKMLFRDAFDWWAVGLLFVFYVITGIRAGRRAPLFFFPLVYFIYLINTEPNGALLPFVMMLSLGIYGIFLLAGGVTEEKRRTLCRIFSVILVSYVLIFLTSMTVYDLARRKEPVPNSLKAAGFFLREHMKPEDKIASLLRQEENILNEYYYGKNFFKSPVFGKYIYDLRNLTEPESSSNPVSAAEIKTDFAFYVVSVASYSRDKRYAAFVDSAIRERSLKKVADLSAGRKAYISIYSARPIKYENIDVKQACAQFDKKYANIKKLFANRHVGLASTWGFY